MAFGANLADPLTQLIRARETLARTPGLLEEAASPIYRTPPWGGVEQPDFYNAVVRYHTTLNAPEALALLHSVEQAHHRVRGIKNGPRTLDLDLLLYDQCQLDSPNLTLPHPRMHERAFVLQPLHDIDPELRIPGRKSVAEHLKTRDTQSQIQQEIAQWPTL